MLVFSLERAFLKAKPDFKW